MDPSSWVLFVLASAAALVVTSYFYRRRETRGRGRSLLAALRWAALAVLILLLFDPELPGSGGRLGGSPLRVLVDASLSMAQPAEAGAATTRWQRAVEEAARLVGKGEVILFGEVPRSVPADSLAAQTPEATASRLLPALQAASEVGARRVVVVTDGALEDADLVRRALPQLGLKVEFRQVGGRSAPGAAIAAVAAPAWVDAGKPLEVRAEVGGAGEAGDSITVVVREGEREHARARVPAPAPGRLAAATLSFTPQAPRGGGLVRYDVALEGSESDGRGVRSVYVRVGERPAGVALVSFRPDWEPRFLQPVLEQALGLPVHGFLRAESGRYLRVGAGTEAGQSSSEAEVQRLVGQADLVVLHGLGADAPAWAREATRRARRVLVFPDASAGDLGLPVTLRAAVPGEWYAAAEIPASPVAPLLTSMRVDALPPLTGIRLAETGGGAWVALQASLGRRGAGSPLVVAGEQGGRRWAVATAEGYWRWAFRDGEPRQTYRRLWAAMAGWLVQEAGPSGDAPIQPAERVVARGEPIRWQMGPQVADSVALRIVGEDGSVALDTVITELPADTLATGAIAPGHYRYEARVFAGAEAEQRAEGPLTVERFSPELIRAAASLASFAGEGGGRAGGGTPPAPGEPLHATPWPYLLLVLLLSTEWVLRRRWGLR